MHCFVDILRCLLCCEEDDYEDRDYSRYEVLYQRRSLYPTPTPTPTRFFEQRSSPSTPSIQQPRYTYGTDYSNQSPIHSVREAPAIKSQPRQPETNHACLSQRNSVDSVRAPTVTKPSALSPSESAKKPISSSGLDLLPNKPSAQKPSAISALDPPKQPSALSPSESAKKPISSSGLDLLPNKPSAQYPSFISGVYLPNKPSAQKPSAISGLDPPKQPSVLSPSESAKKPISSSGLDLLPNKPSAQNPSFISGVYLAKKPSVQKPSAISGLDPPKKPSASTAPDPPKKFTPSSGSELLKNPASDPPKKPSGLSATSNWRHANVLPVYHIPEDIKHIIDKDQVPGVLKMQLNPSNYADYFAALLYAEDYYMEKWSEFLKEFVLSGISLRLREETISAKSRKSNKTVYMNQMGRLESNKEEKRVYVEFDMDSIPERRPYLLAKDYVYVRRSNKTVKPFQGFLLRVEKSKLLLAEFGKDFHAQYSLTNKYDVWFDFNRVCLKRCHQGVAAAVDPSFRGFLFPEQVSRSRRQIPIFTNPFNRNLDQVEMSAVNQILSLKGPPPYLIVESSSARSYGIIVEAVLQIYRTFKGSRILIVAPQNHTCDSWIIRLKGEIPDSEMFRANAAFRERDEVPKEILSSSLYEGECFTCPPSEDLRKFKVIASTFVSSFRLHCHGIYAGHFSHIFVVDACYATEPETMVTLANLADQSTAVVLTGSSEHYARWVRSDIARANGLRRSYFKRLLESEPYKSRELGFVKYL